MRRRVTGRAALDMRRLAKAIEAPGIDLRHWVSHGTIGVVGDDGKADFTDNQAIVCGPDGVWADVLLMPLMIPVTARVQLGVGGSMCQISAPVRPGDEVLVIIPDGNLLNPPIIIAVLNAMSAQVGLDADTKPVFRNDRLLVFSNGVPVEVVCRGADVTFIADNVKIGGRDASEPLVLGNKWKTKMESIITDVINHKHGSAVGPTSPTLPPEALTLAASKQTLPDDISDTNFTKKTNDGT